MKTVMGLLGLASLGLAGCAKSPDGSDGGPSTGTAVNRMTVTMNLQQAIDQAGENYYYAFAFDDDQDRSDFPRAIVGPTSLLNGVVGGSFTVLVQYHAGIFTASRRTQIGDGDSATETLVQVPNAFVTAPRIARGSNTITFTLNLDATYTDPATKREVRFFRSPSGGAPVSLQANFVTTDRPSRDPNTLNANSYDALYPFSPGRDFTISDIRATQTIDNRVLNIEPPDDVFRGTNRNVNTAALDITNFRIDIIRANS